MGFASGVAFQSSRQIRNVEWLFVFKLGLSGRLSGEINMDRDGDTGVCDVDSARAVAVCCNTLAVERGEETVPGGVWDSNPEGSMVSEEYIRSSTNSIAQILK